MRSGLTALAAELERSLEQQSAAGYFSGAILLAQAGRPALRRAFGQACRRFGVPNQVDTRFDIALQTGVLLSLSSTETVLDGKVATGRRPCERYAYGFFEEKIAGVRVVGHGGTIPGYQSWLDLYLELGYVLIVLSNLDHPTAETVAHKVRDLVVAQV